MVAPALPSFLFSFPLTHLIYPYHIPHKPSISPFAYNPSLTSHFHHFIDYHWSKPYPGISTDVNFNKYYSSSVLITSLHDFAGKVLQLPSSKERLQELGIIRNQSSLSSRLQSQSQSQSMEWYRICVNNLLQPSDLVKSYLAPYLSRFEGRYIIGMHVRMGEGAGKWKEGKTFVKIGSVRYQIPGIQKRLKSHPGSLFFLATDSDKVEKMMRTALGKAVVTVNNLPRMHVGRRDAEEAGVLRSILDLYLLGECDFLYVTPDSGFSRIGTAFNKKKVTVVFL